MLVVLNTAHLSIWQSLSRSFVIGIWAIQLGLIDKTHTHIYIYIFTHTFYNQYHYPLEHVDITGIEFVGFVWDGNQPFAWEIMGGHHGKS